VNETYRELKERLRRLDEVLVHRGHANMEFAQAVSRLRRAARRGDRSREPSTELRGLLERAETLARSLG
jgi:tRNA C32,U32 (ribose-2'-O)-methylase TrmJ